MNSETSRIEKPWTKGSLAFGIGLLATEGVIIAAQATEVLDMNLPAAVLVHGFFTVAGVGLTASSALNLRRQYPL